MRKTFPVLRFLAIAFFLLVQVDSSGTTCQALAPSSIFDNDQKETKSPFYARQATFYEGRWNATVSLFQGEPSPSPAQDGPVIDVSLNAGFTAVARVSSDFPPAFDDRLVSLAQELMDISSAYKVPAAGQFHITVFEVFHENLSDFQRNESEFTSELWKNIKQVSAAVKNVGPFEVVLKGVNLMSDGTVIVNGYVPSDKMYRLRALLSEKIPRTDWRKRDIFHITLGRLHAPITPENFRKVYDWAKKHHETHFGSFVIRNPMLIAISNKHATVIDARLQEQLVPYNREILSPNIFMHASIDDFLPRRDILGISL